MWFDPKNSELLGKVIKSVSLPDDTNIVFLLEDGTEIRWFAQGDCCSETWFENISGIGALSGNKVIEIIPREFTKEVLESLKAYRQESDELYGYSLKVEVTHYHGYQSSIGYEMVDIDFRNSSNGYYGGWIEEFIDNSKKGDK
jgi:hypothetical protein